MDNQTHAQSHVDKRVSSLHTFPIATLIIKRALLLLRFTDMNYLFSILDWLFIELFCIRLIYTWSIVRLFLRSEYDRTTEQLKIML